MAVGNSIFFSITHKTPSKSTSNIFLISQALKAMLCKTFQDAFQNLVYLSFIWFFSKLMENPCWVDFSPSEKMALIIFFYKILYLIWIFIRLAEIFIRKINLKIKCTFKNLELKSLRIQISFIMWDQRIFNN